MHCGHCGKELQENETCACRSSEEQARRSSFPLWLIPGAICAVITLGYVALKIAGYNYFLWVHVIWSISAVAFFYLKMKNIKHAKRAFEVIGAVLLTILVSTTACNAYFFAESVSSENKHVFVSDMVDRHMVYGVTFICPLVYEYRNFIWYGPFIGRLSDIYDEDVDIVYNW